MTDLNADEQAVADLLATYYVWTRVGAEDAAQRILAALDLPARDAAVRATVAEEIALALEARTGPLWPEWCAALAREHGATEVGR